MENDLDLILKETARLARDYGFHRTADKLEEALADLRAGSCDAVGPRVPQVLH